MKSTPVIYCKNCGNSFTGKFCNECGEKVYLENHRSFKHLVEEVFHFVTHFDGSFITSVKTIISKPGKISEDFCNGIRKKYFKPLSFFLLMVILYLLFPILEGLNMRLEYYQGNRLFGSYVTNQVRQVKEKENISDEQLSEAFHHKGEKISKFLLFILVPFMASASFLMGFKKRNYYFDHFIFSTESLSFFILWGFLIVPLMMVLASKVGIQLFQSESTLTIIVYSGLCIFLIIGSIRFFHFSILSASLYSVFFSVGLFFSIEYVYKLILFSITIHLV